VSARLGLRAVLRGGIALLGALALSSGLAACGSGSSPSASALLSQTFSSQRSVDSGQVDLSFALSAGASGTPAGQGPISLHLTGPFQSAGSGQFPRFALALTVDAAGQKLKAGAVSTGGRLYLELAGVAFLAPSSTKRAIEEGYAQASRAASPAAGRSSFAALGIDPGAWLRSASVAGSANVAGAETVHIVAGLDAARFLADVQRLASSGGALAGNGASLLTPARVAALSGSVRSARVDIYTGAHDHLLRRLALSAELSTTPSARAALGGLGGGTLTFALEFSQLNRPQTITAPSNPQPLTRLGPVLGRLRLPGRPLR
jgi:hypothetical protein